MCEAKEGHLGKKAKAPPDLLAPEGTDAAIAIATPAASATATADNFKTAAAAATAATAFYAVVSAFPITTATAVTRPASQYQSSHSISATDSAVKKETVVAAWGCPPPPAKHKWQCQQPDDLPAVFRIRIRIRNPDPDSGSRCLKIGLKSQNLL
jgi:hypothetical protein